MRYALASLLVFSCASGQERISMIDDSDSTSIKDVVRGAIRAFDEEDIDSYESHFKASQRSSIRKNVAYVFADEDCSMELVDIHVIDDGGDRASAAVKYKVGGSRSSFTILSEVRFVKEDGKWLIEKEIVKSRGPAQSQASFSSVAVAAPGRDPAWNPMNPDPNRISPKLNHLIGDIGIREGIGCGGGGCANGRCPVR